MLRSTRVQRVASYVLVISLFLLIPSVSAETISIEFGCTLNNAIRSALADTSVGGCRAGDPGRDIIYVVDTVQIVEDPVEITQDMGFVGDRFTSTLDGQGKFSFFRIGAGVMVNLQDFFMSNGYGTEFLGQIRVEEGGRVHLNTANIINCKGVKEIVAASVDDVGIGLASSVCGKEPPFNPHPPVLVPPENDPNPPAEKPDRPRSKAKKSRKKVTAATTATPPPRVHTCEHLPENIVVYATAGLRSGVQCQEINERGVGIQSVIDQGILLAVDVWGYVDPGAQVCFRGSGSLIFLDAANAPRQASKMASVSSENWTCGTIHRAGSLVLVQSAQDAHSATPAVVALTSCQVRALEALNFRNAPAGSIIYGLVPKGATLNANARNADWFQVNRAGLDGWISADFVDATGNCQLVST